jgi:FMN-dependent NADH-azoreductase
MATLLEIKSSIFGDNGNSSQLVNDFVQQWRVKNADGTVISHDLSNENVPHLDATRVGALFSEAESRTADQQAVIDFSDSLIKEINAADVIVIGVPMYNFGIPSALKAYFDHIARAGVTFKYTDTGPVGLIEDKPVYIIAARGGQYHGTPADMQTGYVTNFLNFIGLKNINFIYAEKLNMGGKDEAFVEAKNQIIAALA